MFDGIRLLSVTCGCSFQLATFHTVESVDEELCALCDCLLWNDGGCFAKQSTIVLKLRDSWWNGDILHTCPTYSRPAIFSGNCSVVADLFESLKRAGKFRRLPHHICTNCTLAIGEFTLHIWRDTHVPKIPWTPATTADANARKAELYQYVIIGKDGDDANDNSQI